MHIFLIIPFLLLYIVPTRGYKLTRITLELIKNIDYEKWEYLMSSSNPLVNGLMGSVLQVNSRRFGKFLREGNHYNSPELEKYMKKCKRHDRLTIISIVLFFVIMTALTFPWHALTQPGYK